MSDAERDGAIDALRTSLQALGKVKIAVSGGVDSMTLALLASRALGQQAHMFHAVSAAVPADATERVKRIAALEHWQLSLINAGEFEDPHYLANPYRRCFHCKKNLYGALAGQLSGVILSGANHDDLDDFRPGLQAAAQFEVRHPFVECAISKAMIRRICRHLGYADLAKLPASPCLSSRVETGLPIRPGVLGFVYQVESRLREDLNAEVVRCRVRHDAIAVQLDPDSLAALSDPAAGDLSSHIQSLADPLGLPMKVIFEPYRMGSAFVELN